MLFTEMPRTWAVQRDSVNTAIMHSYSTPSLMYASIVWAPGLPSFMWTQLERPLVTMLSRQLRGKSTVPHDIIRADFSLPPMLVEALFQVVTFIILYNHMLS